MAQAKKFGVVRVVVPLRRAWTKKRATRYWIQMPWSLKISVLKGAELKTYIRITRCIIASGGGKKKNAKFKA